MATDRKLRYMQTRIWEGETVDRMREVFLSLYARDGAHTDREAMDILLKRGDNAEDLLFHLLYEQVSLTDTYFADFLLPLSDYYDDWLRNAVPVRNLITEARRACKVLDLMVEGPECGLAPEQRARDVLNYAEVAQRLLAYDAVLAMVVGSREAVCAMLYDVAQATLTNVAGLLEDTPKRFVPDEYYLAWCHSAGGTLVLAAEYVLEPLAIAAEAAKVTAHEALARMAIDEVARGLSKVAAGGHEDIIHDIELELVALRAYLDCEDV